MNHLRTIFITGGSGFLGTNLLERIAHDKKYRVHALTRSERASTDAVSFVQGTLERPENYREALADSDAVIHLAGEINITASLASPRENIEHNLNVLISLLEEIRRGGRRQLVVFASTDRVYGASARRTVTESEPAVPFEPYTAAKILGETLLELYRIQYGIPYIVLRIDSIYGPRQPRTMFISDIIQKMLSQDVVEVGDLATKKNFVYVGDVVDALLAAVEAPETVQNQIYNIGGEFLSMKEIAATAKKLIERRRSTTITLLSAKAQDRPRSAEVKPFHLSTRKAQSKLGWQPTTSLEQGLAATITYFADNHEKKQS